MSMQFIDNSIHVNSEIKKAVVGWLEEMAGELKSQTIRNTKGGGSGLRDRWQHHVDESSLVATVGNPMELAIWYEYGTGEHALNKDGRKGYWVYVKDGGQTKEVEYPSNGTPYTLEEAKRIMAMLKADGLDAHITNGMKPHRPFEQARSFIQPRLQARLKYYMEGMK